MVAWKFDGGAPEAEVAAENGSGKCSVVRAGPGGASSATSALGRWGVIRERQAPELGCHFYRILARKMRGIHHGKGADSVRVCVCVRPYDFVVRFQVWLPESENVWILCKYFNVERCFACNIPIMTWYSSHPCAFSNQNRQVTQGCHYPLTLRFPPQLNVGQNEPHSALTVDSNGFLLL